MTHKGVFFHPRTGWLTNHDAELQTITQEEEAMRTFELRVYKLRTKEALDL
jgi:hypothetical protein